MNARRNIAQREVRQEGDEPQAGDRHRAVRGAARGRKSAREEVGEEIDEARREENDEARREENDEARGEEIDEARREEVDEARRNEVDEKIGAEDDEEVDVIRLRPASMPLEILHFALVLLGGLARGKRAEVAPLAGARIGLARVEAVFAGGEFADHEH